MPNRKYSKILHDGPQQAASRSMLRGAGFKDEDFEKSIVGIASLGLCCLLALPCFISSVARPE